MQTLPCFPENKTGSYISFLSKNNTRAYFGGMLFIFIYQKHYSLLFRDPDQLFVYSTQESPAFVKWSENRRYFNKFDHGFINITMTHRTDSDIFFPYTREIPLIKMLSQGKSRVDELLAQKKNVAVSSEVGITFDLIPVSPKNCGKASTAEVYNGFCFVLI